MSIGVSGEGAPEKKIKAGKQYDPEGKPQVFTLSFGGETVSLDAGKAWGKIDTYKWISRGLIEGPQSFHVLPGGTIEINNEKISLQDPNGVSKLEYEINKSHSAPTPPRSLTSGRSIPISNQTRPSSATQVHFKARLDHLGHIMIECERRAERTETGLRGLQSLILSGLMLKPNSIHIDPLQRSVEIDGVRFEASETGVRELQETLNAKYAPQLKEEEEDIIEIKENPGAATGFDISFVTIHSGMRLKIKGHLSQAYLDILQDPLKSDLLHPGIVLRLASPYLYIRRRRPDGGEERIPEFPDVQYRRLDAEHLKQILNHPMIRRTAGTITAPIATEPPEQILQMRLVHHPQSRLQLWLECKTDREHSEGKAFTHHNLLEFSHQGVFRRNLDVSLSFDNQTLTVFNRDTQQAEKISVDTKSSEEELQRASQMLTNALKAAESA